MSSLDEVFVRYQSGYAAFIDETYLVAREQKETTFYCCTLYMLPVSSIQTVQAELREIVRPAPQLQRGNNPYYHSTEFFQHPDGCEIFDKLCSWIGKIPREEHLLLTVQSPITAEDANGELARAKTLISLIGQAHKKVPKLRVVVYEQRHHKTLRDIDKRTIKEAVSSGKLSRNLNIHAGSPSRFNCLWVPDTAAYALRRERSQAEPRWFDRMREVAEVTEV